MQLKVFLYKKNPRLYYLVHPKHMPDFRVLPIGLFSIKLALSSSHTFTHSPSLFHTHNSVKAAVGAGIVFLVAAGNESQNACNRSPASEPTAITVMCSDSSDAFCYFSNYGSCTDIIAPGMSITSTWINGPYSDNTISGTSMSTPHVAGVVAQLLSASSTTLTPEQVRTEKERKMERERERK